MTERLPADLNLDRAKLLKFFNVGGFLLFGADVSDYILYVTYYANISPWTNWVPQSPENYNYTVEVVMKLWIFIFMFSEWWLRWKMLLRGFHPIGRSGPRWAIRKLPFVRHTNPWPYFHTIFNWPIFCLSFSWYWTPQDRWEWEGRRSDTQKHPLFEYKFSRLCCHSVRTIITLQRRRKVCWIWETTLNFKMWNWIKLCNMMLLG